MAAMNKIDEESSTESEIASVVRQIESDLAVVNKEAGKNKTILGKTDEILYKHLTDLKLRINYLHPGTFDSFEIIRKYRDSYLSPFSSEFKGDKITINQNIDVNNNNKNNNKSALIASIFDENPEITQPNDPFQSQLIRFDKALSFDNYDKYDSKIVILFQFSLNNVVAPSQRKDKSKSKNVSKQDLEEWNELWDPNIRHLDSSTKYFIGIVPNTIPSDRYNLSCEESQINEKDPTKISFYGIGTFKDTIYLGGGRRTWDCAEDVLNEQRRHSRSHSKSKSKDFTKNDEKSSDGNKTETTFKACIYGVDDTSDTKIPTKPGIYKNDIVKLEIDLKRKTMVYFVHRTDDELVNNSNDDEKGNNHENVKFENMKFNELKFEKIGTIVLGDDVDTTLKASQKIPKEYMPCVGLGEQGACVKVMFL